jgi:cytochrome c-type biogenesis protein CcmH/NrfG
MQRARAIQTPLLLGSRPDPWLYGRWLDLIVGCGLGYLALVPVLLGYEYVFGVHAWPLAAVVAFGMLINAPHYGATVLRVYGNRGDRAKYRFFALHVTLALAIVFAGASRSVWLASALITIYLTWSPWHFAGQNYGLALMFLRRRGIEVDARTKRLFYLSFVLSAALAMVALHGGVGQFSVTVPTLEAPTAPRLLSLGIPAALTKGLFAVFGAAYVACLAAVAWRLRRTGSWSDQAPAWTLVCTQALWYTVPVLSMTEGESLAFAAVWVSAAHSLQYLWVTAYYAKRSPAHERVGPFLVKTLAAGTAVTILPALLFAPDLFGRLPWDAGLAITTFSIVNIHHFILDGAIWKLRDGGIARVLLRSSADSEAQFGDTSRKSAVAALVWTVAALSLVVPAMTAYEAIGMYLDARPDRTSEAAWRARWIGRETVRLHLDAGAKSEQAGHDREAVEHYRRSIQLFPLPEAWELLAGVYLRHQQTALAYEAYDRAVALRPDSPGLLFRRAQLRLALAESGERPDPYLEETIATLRRVLEVKPDYAAASLLLARLAASSGQRDEAEQILERGIAAAGEEPSPRLRARLAQLRGE